jgi:hypothetical protein
MQDWFLQATSGLNFSQEEIWLHGVPNALWNLGPWLVLPLCHRVHPLRPYVTLLTFSALKIKQLMMIIVM